MTLRGEAGVSVPSSLGDALPTFGIVLDLHGKKFYFLGSLCISLLYSSLPSASGRAACRPRKPRSNAGAPGNYSQNLLSSARSGYLCGDEVPLQDPEVREDLDREFNIVLWNRTQTTMWLKRAARYFPYLEKRLQEANLPDDLKYVVLVESDLRMNARSHAGACGPWQFMKPAANRFMLKTDDKIDDRYDLSRATDAALQYFKTLYRTFHNWPLAIAAYNCGEGRVKKAMDEQGCQHLLSSGPAG